ncbi:MAG: TIR domain-containing protein [Gammaproteobacteria bacterium]|nr:TIR domain-containing protein [Gammaproteobacteria bacterium]
MTGSPRAVFLSYASQDEAAAQRICEGLRAAGVEVWFDRSELRGGEAWDRQIRRQIHDCALFIAIISGHSDARNEGYFRREWKLAVDRTADMAEDVAFLLPVVIDDTPDASARVPERFHEVQWSRLPGGQTSPGFIVRVLHLLAPDASPRATAPAAATASAAKAPGGAATESKVPDTSPHRAGFGSRLAWIAAALAVLVAGYFLSVKVLRPGSPATPATTGAAQTASEPGAGAVSEKSIAVLPFADMSEKKDQEYFSDGLAEELLDLLAKTPGLHVIARTSSFSFKGKSDDIPTIAAKLRVANILEGSVRKSGSRLRVTTQLVRASDGEHLWSETYDNEVKDIFKVQDEIASAVVAALKLKLSPGQASSPRRSANTDAYLQYLLGQQYFNRGSDQDLRQALAAYHKAIELDPRYAAAYSGLAYAEAYLVDATGDASGNQRAKAAAERAIELAPDQAIGYTARGDLRFAYDWDWTGAQADFAKALELEPNDPFVLRRFSILMLYMGHVAEAVANSQKATELDPFSVSAWSVYGGNLEAQGDSAAAADAYRRALAINPRYLYAIVGLGILELNEHRPAEALATFQKLEADPLSLPFRLTGTAMAEHSLAHDRESRLALDEAIAKDAQSAAYQIAEAFAWRGERDRAFEWLDRAYRQRDGGLVILRADSLMRPLRADPRFKAMLKKINLDG